MDLSISKLRYLSKKRLRRVRVDEATLQTVKGAGFGLYLEARSEGFQIFANGLLEQEGLYQQVDINKLEEIDHLIESLK